MSQCGLQLTSYENCLLGSLSSRKSKQTWTLDNTDATSACKIYISATVHPFCTLKPCALCCTAQTSSCPCYTKRWRENQTVCSPVFSGVSTLNYGCIQAIFPRFVRTYFMSDSQVTFHAPWLQSCCPFPSSWSRVYSVNPLRQHPSEGHTQMFWQFLKYGTFSKEIHFRNTSLGSLQPNQGTCTRRFVCGRGSRCTLLCLHDNLDKVRKLSAQI